MNPWTRMRWRRRWQRPFLAPARCLALMAGERAFPSEVMIMAIAKAKDSYACTVGCGGTKQVAKGSSAPSCCGKPMKIKKK